MVKSIESAKISKAKLKDKDWRSLEKLKLELTFKTKPAGDIKTATIQMFNSEDNFKRLTLLKEFASVTEIERLPESKRDIKIATIDGVIVGIGLAEEDEFVTLKGVFFQFNEDQFFSNDFSVDS